MPFVRGALSGLLFSLAFPTVDAWFVAFVAMVPFLLTLESLAREAREGKPRAVRRGFAAGLGFGLGLYVPLLWWIVLLDAPALTIPWIRYPAPFAIALVESSVTGLMGAGVVFVRARHRWPLALLAPSLWCVAEWLRGSGELGFPWGVLGYSQVPFLPALQVAWVAGLTGLTFWIVAVNALVTDALAGGRRLRPALLAVVLVLVPILGGAWRLSRAPDREDGETVRVALVQPDVGSHDKWRPDNRANIFATMAQLTREGAAAGAELVVWPETAAPCYVLKDDEWRPYVQKLARDTGTFLFLGLPDYQAHIRDGTKRIRYTNTGALFDSRGRLAGTMDKIQLVPFGEHVPYASRFRILERIDFGEADFVPGDGPVIFRMGNRRFANLVCFEAIFPHLTRRYANLGADFLVNITNDSWFGAGAGAIAHRNMAVVRCVETGCGMARCANSGISTGIDAYGRTFGETGLFERTVSVVDVPLRRGRTPFARFGDWVGWLARIVTAVSVLGAVAWRGKMR